MSKPRKMGNLRLSRYLAGTQQLTLRFDHQEYGDTVKIPVDSDSAGSQERYSTYAGLEFHGGHLVDSCVTSDQVRAPESWMAQHEESPRSTCAKGWGRTINVDVETDSTAAMGMCSRTGVGKTRHIQVRWLWIQDAIRDKVVRLKKVKSTENVADLGTKDLDGPTHKRLLQKLPLKPTLCRRLLGLIATASGGSVAEAQVAGDDGDFWTFSAQVTIAILVASSDECDGERMVVQHNASSENC